MTTISAEMRFSNHWKNRGKSFQSLEKTAGIFPIIGKMLVVGLWAAAGFAAPPQLTTRQQTIRPVALPMETPLIAPSNLPAYAAQGYSAWVAGAGEDAGRRFDLMPSGYAGAPNAARLLSFFSMSDIHITDKESPAQGLAYGWLSAFGSGTSSAYSPVILSTTHLLDAAIRAANALHEQNPFDFGVFLGDAINSTQCNELRWYMDVIDGKPITPSSGAHLGTNAIGYQMSYQAAGLNPAIPWYQVIGNHDQFWSGVTFINDKLMNTLVGSNILNMGMDSWDPDAINKTGMYMGVVDGSTPYGVVVGAGLTNSFATPPTVAADTNRHSLATTNSPSLNWMAEFFNTDSLPVGHGFTQTNLDNDFACYTFEPKTNLPIKVIVLDNTAKTNIPSGGRTYFPYGVIDQARYTWLTNELQKGQDAGQLMMIATHVPILPQKDIFNTNLVSAMSAYSSFSDTQMIATLHGYPNLILLMAGHRHQNTVTPHPSPDPGHPENGFWEVETASLRDFPQQFRTFDIRRNTDHTISIFTTSVDPQFADGTSAADSRGYAVGAMRVFGGTNTFADTRSHAYNAELVVPLSPAMQTKIAGYGTASFTNTIAVMSAYITNAMAEQGVHGLSIALVESNQIVWSQGFGLAVVESNVAATAQTVYRIGSVSKVFTTLSVLKLWEDGQVDLEAPITNYVPAFAILPRYAAQRTPTVRECLNHQSGLPGDMFRNGFATEPWDGFNAWILNELRTDYPNYPAGFRSVYCNTGFQLIEELVRNVTGMTLYDFARTNFYGPMGMVSSSYLKDRPNIAARLARAYMGDFAFPEEFVSIRGTGGMYSSVEDLSAMVRLILAEGRFNGTNLLSTNTIAAMLTDQTTNIAMDVDSDFRPGLGWDSVNNTSLGYAGRYCYKDGQTFTFYCSLMILPDRQLGVVVMNNTPGSLPNSVATETLKQALLERDGLPQPTNFSPVVTAETNWSTEAIAAVTGLYVTAEGIDAGFDYLETAPDGSLTWTLKAHTASPIVATGLVPHADGWIYRTAQPAMRILPTLIAGHSVLLYRMAEDYGEVQAYRGERYAPPPIPAAWSNRLNTDWYPVNMPPTDLYWSYAQLGTDVRLRMTNRNGLIWLTSPSGGFVIAPSNDALGFAAGSAIRRGASVVVTETNGIESLRFSSYTYRREDAFPALPEGATTNGLLTAHQTEWFSFNAVSGVYYGVTLTNHAADVLVKIGDDNWRAGPIGWTCSSNGAFLLGLSATSATPFSVRLYTLTNTIARLSSLVTNLMAANGLVGCGLSLVDGAQTVWQTGFGHADLGRGIPADENTVFLIGSCSKTFGAIAAMQLVETSQLDLDAPFTNALPSFSIHQRFAGHIITPRTILTHLSGMPGDIFNHGFTIRPNYEAPDQLQAILADDYTLMPTNTCWAYNNSGFVMLGQAFRHITGQPLDQLARSNLFDRMGMAHSSIIHDLPHIQSHLSRPYAEGAVYPDEYCDLFFAGSVYSTAADIARYMRMLLAGGMGDHARVLSNATLAAMTVKQNSGVALDQFNTMLNMGLGFVLDPPALHYMGKIIWHDGGTVYFRTLMRVALDAQLGCFISFNCPEGEEPKEEIVNSALKWAYEEKTGVTPPPPVDPGTPAAALAPPETIALATGGVFVTSAGFDRFVTNATGLAAYFNAHTESPGELALVYRENGWYTPTNAYTPQYSFTQAAGHTVCVLKNFGNGVTNTSLLSERSTGIHGFDPAWSNRLGRWWATDMDPDDISWLIAGAMCSQMLELYAQGDLLLLARMAHRAGSSFVLSATNDALAFAAGVGRNKGSALRAAGPDSIVFMGVTYQSETGLPVILPGTATNGVTTGDETFWFHIPAPTGQPVTVDLATEHDLTAYLYDTNAVYLGQANRAHAFHLAAASAQPLMAAVIRNGTNVGPWQCSVLTNAIPFYRQLEPQDWPADLIAHSNLYGDLEFGHVFAHENRTNPAGNLLKIAVAQMKSSLPAAQALLYCAGGPGSPSVVCAYQHYLKAFTNAYDVYLVDQRGIGHTQPWLELREDETPSDMQYRITMLEGGDLSALNTVESSCDFNDLAAVFGLTNANLYGVSYGTLLAQTIMRGDPAWLRAVVLEGVMAPNIPPLSQTGPMRNDAVSALFADVAAHPQASAWYPVFPTEFYLLGTNLQDHPVPVAHGGRTNAMDDLTYLNQVLQQMTISDLGCRERIPNIVWRALRGENAALSELYTDKTDTNTFPPNVRSELMQVMILKHDILPFDTMAAASNACANLSPLMRDLNIKFMQDFEDIAALFDPMGQADASFTLPVTSAIPTLVMNGAYDTQTGTNWAAEVARNLPHAYLVTVPTVGHCVLKGGDCPQQIIRDFLANPWQAPDTTCLASLALDFPPPWLDTGTNLAPGQTVTNVFDQPSSGAWRSFAAVSGVVYSIQQAVGPRLTVVDALARPQATTDTALLEWESPLDGTCYLWSLAPEAGEYTMLFDLPLLLRSIAVDGPQLSLRWQSYTNTTCNAWLATNLLAPQNEHVRIATNLAAEGWFTTLRQPLGTNAPACFFYLRE